MPHELTLADLMRDAHLLCLPPTYTVSEASKLMLERNLGVVLVTEPGEPDRLVGIMTERDINFRLVAIGLNAATTAVAQIMTRAPRSLPPKTPVTAALQLMARRGYRHMPIKDNGQVVGVVSITDVFRESRKRLGLDMDMMEHFIMTNPLTPDSESTH